MAFSIEDLIADYYSHAWKNCRTFADSEDTLKQLRARGYKLGIITNGSSRSQRAKLAGTRLLGLVDTALVSGEEEIKKPDPEIFFRATRQLQVPASDCIFVGDNPQADIAGAHNAGMKAVWVKRYSTWPDTLSFSPDYTISTVAELLQIPF